MDVFVQRKLRDWTMHFSGFSGNRDEALVIVRYESLKPYNNGYAKVSPLFVPSLVLGGRRSFGVVP